MHSLPNHGTATYNQGTKRRTQMFITTGRKQLEFHPGQNIVERTNRNKYRKTSKILDRHQAPRSYWVLNHNDNIIRSTSKDIKASSNNYRPVEDYTDLENLRTSQESSINLRNIGLSISCRKLRTRKTCHVTSRKNSMGHDEGHFRGFSLQRAEAIPDIDNVVYIGPEEVVCVGTEQASGNKCTLKQKPACADCLQK
ncbi:hypothetical protein PR048_020806 [Dryococelus australis]|uniref:Uncharacterized protein n=1 Tax=Dryococelus australis TaxID=614101 RepID=A0ABQ9GWG2_9NEOP|nr:hypothetical protein PR048_020806 [Dryococelus australis]